MTALRCRFGVHDWTKWRRTRVHLIDSWRGGESRGTVDAQLRECRRCGYEQTDY